MFQLSFVAIIINKFQLLILYINVYYYTYYNFAYLIQGSSVSDISSVFAAYLQIAIENSAGAMKVKVVEYGADKPFEGIYMPNVVNIIESEPLLSVRNEVLNI